MPAGQNDETKGDGKGQLEQKRSEEPGFVVRDRRFWADESRAAEGEKEEPATPAYPTYVEQLRAELEAARREAAEKDERLREYIAAYKEEVVHGLEEVKQRLTRDAEKQLELRRGELVGGLLEVLDNLHRSLEAADKAQNLGALLEGVRLVEAQFLAQLGALGLQRIDAVGEPFDPALHEAVAMVPVTDPAQDRQVVNEIRAGYRCGERILRPALVTVGTRAS